MYTHEHMCKCTSYVHDKCMLFTNVCVEDAQLYLVVSAILYPVFGTVLSLMIFTLETYIYLYIHITYTCHVHIMYACTCVHVCTYACM